MLLPGELSRLILVLWFFESWHPVVQVGHYAAEKGLERLIILTSPLTNWGDRCVRPRPAMSQ